MVLMFLCSGVYKTECVYMYVYCVHAMLCYSLCSTYEGKAVNGKDYEVLLQELVNICALCNDSTLGYCEVSILCII